MDDLLVCRHTLFPLAHFLFLTCWMQQLQKQSTDILVGTPQVLSSLLVYFSRPDSCSPPPDLGASTSEAIDDSNESVVTGAFLSHINSPQL